MSSVKRCRPFSMFVMDVWRDHRFGYSGLGQVPRAFLKTPSKFFVDPIHRE